LCHVNIFTGLPASGKSSYFQQAFRDSHVRVNLDMLRNRTREEILVHACLVGKTPFVVDNTNLSKKCRERYIRLAHASNFTANSYFFVENLDVCLRRNPLRVAKTRVPDRILQNMYERLEKPTWDEGWDRMFLVVMNMDPEIHFTVSEMTPPPKPLDTGKVLNVSSLLNHA